MESLLLLCYITPMVSPDRQHSSAGKDSFLRKMFGVPLDSVSKNLHKALPSVTPNQITTTGLVAVVAGAMMMQSENTKSNPDKMKQAAALGLQGIGYLCDALDGGVARQIKKETNGEYHNPVGVILDVTTDRVQESVLAFLRSRAAAKRKDLWGQVAADGAMLTTSLPTLTREIIMWLDGREVHEVGTDPLAFMGSRPGRVVMNTLSGMSPRYQRYLDGVQVLANFYSAGNRYLTRGEKIDETSRNVSRSKSLALLPVAAAATVVFAASRRVKA